MPSLVLAQIECLMLCAVQPHSMSARTHLVHVILGERLDDGEMSVPRREVNLIRRRIETALGREGRDVGRDDELLLMAHGRRRCGWRRREAR